MTEPLAPDGTPITVHDIAAAGLRARLTSWGSVLMDLRLDGHAAPLVLGFEDPCLYLKHSPYFGATAGRYANRIAHGRFSIDGTTFQADCNFLGEHTLHGGEVSMGKRNWDTIGLSENSVTMTIGLQGGEMGFPGALRAEVTYTLCVHDDCPALRIDYRATCDAPTLCNLAHHSYWALDGSGDLRHHTLQVDAARYTPVDAELIPTGEIADVNGTRFDFRTPRPVLDALPIDHNLCLGPARVARRRVAQLRSRLSGIAMDITTTEPGLQVYDGSKINVSVPGLGGRLYEAHAGVALEPQIWPDAPNHDGFPDAVLRPGETYRQTTIFSFSKEAPDEL
jgi:aldose 1-epimerase